MSNEYITRLVAERDTAIENRDALQRWVSELRDKVAFIEAANRGLIDENLKLKQLLVPFLQDDIDFMEVNDESL